jgi:hypothetical protein
MQAIEVFYSIIYYGLKSTIALLSITSDFPRAAEASAEAQVRGY